MSTTLREMITASLRLCNVVQAGTAPTDQEMADGASALVQLIDSWSNQRLLVHTVSPHVYDLQPGKRDYTLGPGGDFDIARPMRIEQVYVTPYQPLTVTTPFVAPPLASPPAPPVMPTDYFLNTFYTYDFQAGSAVGTTVVSNDGFAWYTVPNAVDSTMHGSLYNLPLIVNKANNAPFALYQTQNTDYSSSSFPVKVDLTEPWSQAFTPGDLPNVNGDFLRLGTRLFVAPSFVPQKIYSTDDTSGFVKSSSSPTIDYTWDLGFSGSTYIARQPGTSTFNYYTYTQAWTSPEGYYTSTDGLNWTPRNRPGGFPHGLNYPTVFAGYSKGRAIYISLQFSYSQVALASAAVIDTTVDGITWQQGSIIGDVSSGGGYGGGYGSNLVPTSNDNVMFLTYGSQLYKSTDGGLTFTRTNIAGIQSGYFTIAYQPNIFIAYNQSDPLTLHTSIDDGASWQAVTAPVDFGNLFSTNGGYERGNGYSAIYGDDANSVFFPSTVYGQTAGTIYKLNNGAFTLLPVDGVTNNQRIPQGRTVHIHGGA